MSNHVCHGGHGCSGRDCACPCHFVLVPGHHPTGDLEDCAKCGEALGNEELAVVVARRPNSTLTAYVVDNMVIHAGCYDPATMEIA